MEILNDDTQLIIIAIDLIRYLLFYYSIDSLELIPTFLIQRGKKEDDDFQVDLSNFFGFFIFF
jgi:hypothetical protein